GRRVTSQPYAGWLQRSRRATNRAPKGLRAQGSCRAGFRHKRYGLEFLLWKAEALMILDQDSRGTGADVWHGFERQRSGKLKRLNADAAHKTLCLNHTAMLAADRRRVN